MQVTMFLFLAFLTVIPGTLLILGALRFKKLIHQPTTLLILIGSLFILLHLLAQAGTYYYSFLGDAESLANYSLSKAWISPVAEYIGLILIAAGLLIFKKK